jgi:two-component system CheB/CheR fusion protein
VIASLKASDQEVRDRFGRWWLLRIRPFLTSDNRIDGATLVAVDIDAVRRSRELMEARDHALAVVRRVREPIVVLDSEGRVGLANDAFYSLFAETPATTQNRLLWETGQGAWEAPDVRQQIQAACRGDHAIENLEIRRVLPGPGGGSAPSS